MIGGIIAVIALVVITFVIGGAVTQSAISQFYKIY